MIKIKEDGQLYFTFEELQNSAKVLSHLPLEMKSLFFQTYVRHMDSLWEGTRFLYTLDKIFTVKWDQKDLCLIVTFINGDKWHYNTLKEWF